MTRLGGLREINLLKIVDVPITLLPSLGYVKHPILEAGNGLNTKWFAISRYDS